MRTGAGSRRGGQEGWDGSDYGGDRGVTSEKEAAGSNKGEKGAELYGRRQPAPCDAKGVSIARERELSHRV